MRRYLHTRVAFRGRRLQTTTLDMGDEGTEKAQGETLVRGTG